ncbi:MAG: hypothetical protein QXZ51_06150, partial [Candidatus Bathyarchaeia archaeon]
LKIVKNYGVETTVSGLNKLYLQRKTDGSCVFLYKVAGMHLCGLQRMKPMACKLWPFKILATPKFGYAKEALYAYGGKTLYVYADSTCAGLIYGRPTWEFANKTLKEFIEIAIGLRIDQKQSKADVDFVQQYPSIRRLF